eukprot:CAMPEP_0119505914 /NCGR_PEP_ID=MMETSP1344-20130328/26332_1 /TAXON_ID=236787 /ORGANISM="Florenciella parvula, Strain CCMP2471" /LENGTH=48 /DNA_ID= /DNA_START= /DNA_END= /DNA_ORIENTATION=
MPASCPPCPTLPNAGSAGADALRTCPGFATGTLAGVVPAAGAGSAAAG